MINSLENKTLLFHDHADDGLRYAYPLIQYKRIGGKAAIVSIGKGTEEIAEFLYSSHPQMRLGTRTIDVGIEGIEPIEHDVQITEEQHTYRLRQWIPLNAENYEKFKQTESLTDRISLLESILVGNILSFAKGIGLFFDKRVICKITRLEGPSVVMAKEVKMAGFNLTFVSNVSLPNNIGLGKHASIGFGVIQQQEKEQ